LAARLTAAAAVFRRGGATRWWCSETLLVTVGCGAMEEEGGAVRGAWCGGACAICGGAL